MLGLFSGFGHRLRAFRVRPLKRFNFAVEVPSCFLQIVESVWRFLPGAGDVLQRVSKTKVKFPSLNYLDRLIRCVSSIVARMVYLIHCVSSWLERWPVALFWFGNQCRQHGDKPAESRFFHSLERQPFAIQFRLVIGNADTEPVSLPSCIWAVKAHVNHRPARARRQALFVLDRPWEAPKPTCS